MKNSGNLLARSWAGKWIFVAYVFVFGLSGQLLAKPAGCPCNPCTCGACHCGGGGGGGGGGSKSGKHHDHHGDHDHAGGVGVGGTVDLGGVGQRHREADPFAADGPSSPGGTSHTPEKHVTTTSKKHEGTPNDPFQNIHCTGPQAKAIAQGDTTPAHD